MLKAKSDLCFVEAPGPICGNGLVEEGEECDQGRQQSDCCENCKLTTGSECEVSLRPCYGPLFPAREARLAEGRRREKRGP